MAKVKKLKLNLGCGLDHKKGWINIDAVAAVAPDLIHNLHQPLPFPDAAADELLAQDILEHFTKEDGRTVVAELSRVLCEGGTARFRVPNIDAIISQFETDPEVRNEFLYGTTKDTGEFGAHKVGFSKASFFELCLSANLVPTSFSTVDTNMEIVCTKQQTISKKMSLLFFIHTFGMGGAEQFMLDLCVALKNRGHHCTIATNHVPFLEMCKRNKVEVLPQNISIDVIGDWKGVVKSFALAPFAAVEYFRLIQKVKPTVVIAVGFSDKFFASFFAWVQQLPLVWIEFGPLDAVFSKFLRLPKVLYFLVKWMPHKVVVPSQNSLNKLTTGARISLAKLERVACGTTIPKTTVVPNAKKVLLCVSRFAKGKGQEVLLKAYALKKTQLAGYQLVFVGEGETLEQCKQLAMELGITEKTVFKGWVKDSKKEIAAATICVFPSAWELEGFGLVTIEAMAHAKPVIAFATGPTPEIVQQGVTGLLVTKISAQALADALLQLSQDAEGRKKMGIAAKKRALDLFSIENSAKEYEQVFVRGIARSLAEKSSAKMSK